MSGTANAPIEELPNDNDLIAAAMAADEEAPPAEGEAPPPAAETPPAEDDGFDLAALRKVGAERKAERERAPVKPEPASASPDLAKLADHMSGAAEQRAAIDAFKTGDASKLAALTGMDEATLYEQWTKRAMNGDAAGTDAKIVALQAELAALKGAKPEGVMTMERYEEIQAGKARGEAVNAFKNAVSDSEKFPVLGKIDANAAISYGHRAADLLRGSSDTPPTLDAISTVAEKLAKEELGGLLAQQGDGRTGDGGNSEAAATSANTGSNGAGGLDNRAAAEAASTLPDFTDESAYIARAIRAAQAD